MPPSTALVIGGGPAGLTVAHELLQRTNIHPIVLEMSDMVGGISRTVNHRGNRIDIGGHRFFSKSDRVMRWWLGMLPLESTAAERFAIRYQGQSRQIEGTQPGGDPAAVDRVMLVRRRKSRIYYMRRFFDYPVRLSSQTVRNLGLGRTARIGASYLKARLLPIRDEQNLEQFLVNRFGRELYRTFFESYTEKVWGVPCRQISASWGAQRIKGLSISKAVAHALLRPFRNGRDLNQKGVETSLVEQFLYPKYGPGQMWETCADEIRRRGGDILMNKRACRLLSNDNRIAGVVAEDTQTGEQQQFEADLVFSTMPIKELVWGLGECVPEPIRQISDGLIYRDFITVGLLVRRLRIAESSSPGVGLTDNWIYIQEPDVRVGRLQIFNNWSPYMVADPDTVWLGLEYFCNEGDELWRKSDAELASLGATELARIGIVDEADVLDQTVIRVPKTYPAYFGTYDRFDELQAWLDRFENLYLLGRNGMHRYNNQDHSMLTAMVAVDNIVAGRRDKANVWGVNTESDYHEERAGEEAQHSGERSAG